jgi:hypothetical protein
MSFETQELLLLQLFFDRAFRARFFADRPSALATLELTSDERADFLSIDAVGFAVDARDRENLVLGRSVASFPLTVGALSALPNGLECVRNALVVDHFVQPVIARAAAFGESLQDAAQTDLSAALPNERAFVNALLAWELRLAKNAEDVRASGEQKVAATKPPVPAHWATLPIQLEPHVFVAQLPFALERLRRTLCAVEPDRLWGHLLSKPVARAQLQKLIAPIASDKMVFVRTRLTFVSRCEADVTHDTVETSSGFIALLRGLDGTHSASELLAGLAHAGAAATLLSGVEAAFFQLLSAGILRVVG